VPLPWLNKAATQRIAYSAHWMTHNSLMFEFATEEKSYRIRRRKKAVQVETGPKHFYLYKNSFSPFSFKISMKKKGGIRKRGYYQLNV